jgi:hypothetical protein
LNGYNKNVIVLRKESRLNGHDIVLPMWARQEVYFHRLRAAPPASNHDEAMQLMAETLNGVEDEFSGDGRRVSDYEGNS